MELAIRHGVRDTVRILEDVRAQVLKRYSSLYGAFSSIDADGSQRLDRGEFVEAFSELLKVGSQRHAHGRSEVVVRRG